MIIMTYYCKHCNRNFFKHIPVCEMNKETTECKYCGKTAKLSPDFLDSIMDKISETKKMAEELHKDLTLVHETLNDMKGEIK